MSPPCLGEADRFSLEALRHIHREMDDDQDGGIEVEESVEVTLESYKWAECVQLGDQTVPREGCG